MSKHDIFLTIATLALFAGPVAAGPQLGMHGSVGTNPSPGPACGSASGTSDSGAINRACSIDVPRISLSPSITWSGSAPGASHLAGLWQQETLTGTSTAPRGSYLWANQINISDGLDVGDVSSSTNLDGLNVQDVLTSAATGSRNAIRGNVVVSKRPADTRQGSSYPAYVGVLPSAYGSVNLGGTETTYTRSAGGLWGNNPNATAASGATNIYNVIGSEVDVTVQSGASTAQKYGLTVVQGSDSSVQGAQDDSAVAIINQSGAIGWMRGLSFGAVNSAFWPIAPNGTIIGAYRGAGSPPRAAYGIDFGNASFSIAAFKSPNFVVDGAGNTNAASYSSGSSAGVSCPAGTVNLSTLTVTNGIVTHC